MCTHWLWVIMVAATVSCTPEWHHETKDLKYFEFAYLLFEYISFTHLILLYSHSKSFVIFSKLAPCCIDHRYPCVHWPKESHNISPHWFFSADLVGTQYGSTDSQSRTAKWQRHILTFSAFILVRHQEVVMWPNMCWKYVHNCKGPVCRWFYKKVIIPGPWDYPPWYDTQNISYVSDGDLVHDPL